MQKARKYVDIRERLMYRDPATWSPEQRVAFWRVQAARYRRLAATETDAGMRVQLLQLAQDYTSLADRLNQQDREAPLTAQLAPSPQTENRIEEQSENSERASRPQFSSF